MKTLFSTIALIGGLSLAGAGLAQPSGGPDAKGNAPIKAVHTINDGTAKRGANSFTEGQARKHILNSGYSSVSGLVKGEDGVWRGAAVKGGATVRVAMDFKGNVSEDMTPPPMAASSVAQTRTPAPMAQTSSSSASSADAPSTGAAGATGATGATTMAHHAHHRMHRRHHWRHHHSHCANPGPNGVACSGIDRNKNGISDKEDHASAH